MQSELSRGRVCFSAREEYRLWVEEQAGTVEVGAEPSGKLRAYGELPVVGDWVRARIYGNSALIEEVLPRRTAFVRKAAGRGSADQCVAANVDVALLVCGLDGDFNVRRLERYLVLAREGGVEPAVLLNKMDLCADVVSRMAEVRTVAFGCRVVCLSALADVTPLKEIVRGRTAVLLGSSGAGKSTILNGLLGEDRMRTQTVRASDSRGRHTTTGAHLIPLPGGGAVIDSPGMRELGLLAAAESVDGIFADIAGIASGCRFTDCSHEAEPGCAVRAAMERGELDGARWASYRKLRGEARRHQESTDVRARLEAKARLKSIHKTARHPNKQRGH